jgi:hypothetical protein
MRLLLRRLAAFTENMLYGFLYVYGFVVLCLILIPVATFQWNVAGFIVLNTLNILDWIARGNIGLGVGLLFAGGFVALIAVPYFVWETSHILGKIGKRKGGEAKLLSRLRRRKRWVGLSAGC